MHSQAMISPGAIEAGFSAGRTRGGVREVNPSKQGGNNWPKIRYATQSRAEKGCMRTVSGKPWMSRDSVAGGRVGGSCCSSAENRPLSTSAKVKKISAGRADAASTTHKRTGVKGYSIWVTGMHRDAILAIPHNASAELPVHTCRLQNHISRHLIQSRRI